jgi:hypothetical protein
MNNTSTIAQIKEQIDAEAQAAQLALYGPAQGLATHQFITARMERMGMLHKKLKKLIGDIEADHILISAMEQRSTPQDYQQER